MWRPPIRVGAIDALIFAAIFGLMFLWVSDVVHCMWLGSWGEEGEGGCHVLCLFSCQLTSCGQSLFSLPLLPLFGPFGNPALAMAPITLHVGFRIKQLWEEPPPLLMSFPPTRLKLNLWSVQVPILTPFLLHTLIPLVQMSYPTSSRKNKKIVESKRNMEVEWIALMPQSESAVNPEEECVAVRGVVCMKIEVVDIIIQAKIDTLRKYVGCRQARKHGLGVSIGAYYIR